MFYHVFFFRNWTNLTKENVLKIIPYFAFAPNIFTEGKTNLQKRCVLGMLLKYIV